MLRRTSIVRQIASSIAMAPSDYSQEDTVEEIERVYFVKFSDFGQLSSAPHVEEHEQWEYRLIENNKPIGTLRSRSIDQGNAYELTIKTYRKDDVGSMECNLGGTKDMHDTVAMLAQRVLRKIRYVYPVPVVHNGKTLELKWEIDVFKLPDGSFYPWVKVDFEVPDASVKAPKFPFQFDEIINASYDATMTDEQRLIVDTLFDQVKSTQ